MYIHDNSHISSVSVIMTDRLFSVVLSCYTALNGDIITMTCRSEGRSFGVLCFDIWFRFRVPDVSLI